MIRLSRAFTVTVVAMALASCTSSSASPSVAPSSGPPSAPLASVAVTPSAAPVTLTLGIQTIAWNKRKDIIAQWEKATGNKVDAQVVDDAQFDQLLSTKLQSGDLWDVFIRYVGQPKMQTYQPDQNLVDLSAEPWVSRVAPGVKAFITYSDGKVYAMPSGAPATLDIVYNKKVFADLGIAVPKTNADLFAALDKIKAGGKVTPIYLAAKDSWPLSGFISAGWPNIAASNPGVIDKLNKNEIKWADIPEFKAMVAMIDKYRTSGYFNKDLSAATYDSDIAAVGEGKAAMTYIGDFMYGSLHERYPSADIGMFPQPTDSGDANIDVTGPGGFYVSKTSKNIDAAKSLLNFLASKDAQEQLLKIEPGTSLYTDVASNPANPLQADVQSYVAAGKTQPHLFDVYLVPYTGDMDQIFGQLISGAATVDRTVSAWDAYCQKIGKQLGLPGF